MTDNDIYQILTTYAVKSQHNLHRYIRFISRRINRTMEKPYDKHHILPKSMFPEFKSEKDNIVCLSMREHYIAHLLLYKIFRNRSMCFAIHRYMTSSVGFKNSRFFSQIESESRNMKRGYANYEDINGVIHNLHKSDRRISSGEVKSIHKNKVCVKDDSGKIFKIDKHDPRLKSGELRIFSVMNSNIQIKNKDGSYALISKTEFRSGEYSGVRTGAKLSEDHKNSIRNANSNFVTVKDESGLTQRVSVDNEDYKSGKLKSIAVGKVIVIDDSGRKFWVDNTDERFKSGELKPALKGIPKPQGFSENMINTTLTVGLDGHFIRLPPTDQRRISGENKSTNDRKHVLVKRAGKNIWIKATDFTSSDEIVWKNKLTQLPKY